jgi:cytochrome c
MLQKRAFVKIVFLFAMLAYFIPSVQANACLGCHAINKKIVGPGFQAVAEKYKSDSSAQVFLKNKIAKGGSGSWGVVPMPANTKLSDADLSLLTSWILRGAPNKN